MKWMKISNVWGVLLLVAGLAVSACAGNEQTAQGGQPSRETPEVVKASKPVPQSLDLANFPRPVTVPGEEHFPGGVKRLPRESDLGPAGSIVFSSRSDTLVVTLCGVNLNCCTESLRASFTAGKNENRIMIYEYLPDVCECFHERDIRFNIYPAPAQGTSLVVFANQRPEVVARGVVE